MLSLGRALALLCLASGGDNLRPRDVIDLDCFAPNVQEGHTDFKFVNSSVWSSVGPNYEQIFGLGFDQIRKIKYSVWSDIVEGAVPYVAGNKVSDYGEAISRYCDQRQSALGAGAKKSVRQWICAQAVLAFAATNVYYLVRTGDGKEVWRLNAPINLLAEANPGAQCSGFAMLVRDLANVAGKSRGLRCEYVGGWLRSTGRPADKVSNHAWNMFYIDGLGAIPGDATCAARAIRGTKKFGQSRDPLTYFYCLPTTPYERELFLAQYWGDVYVPSDKNIYGIDYKQSKSGIRDPLTNLSIDEWKQSSTSDYLPLWQKLTGNRV